ncbi:LuxR C-terminal-related transcriptional regulator [Cellulomonas iranensis]|uniref:LuxR C-terminal-related transcriptional regulator n=1 Tax=Cellulomonas iranensis TaxID=76862 RepID=UPI003D7D83FA
MTIADHATPSVARHARVPAAPLAVERPRCTAAIAAAVVRAPVVLVTAPPGFGKTTAVRRWATQRGGVAWVTADAFDADACRVLGAVAHAVARAHPSARTAAVAAADGAPGRMLDELADVLGALPSGAVVVLDDAHVLASPSARRAAAELLRLPGPRFVLVGRTVPDLALHRARLAGDVTEVGPAVLALTERETGALLRAWGARAVDPRAVADVWRVTGGWPAAVRAAWAAGLLHRARAARPLRPADVPIGDYVREEVLGGLPPATDAFLRRACVGHVADAHVAEALVPGGARALDECVARGLLPAPGVRPTAPSAAWHDLLAWHVRELVARTEPGVVRAVHAVLARQLAAVDADAAVQHAVEAHAPSVATELLAERWPELLARGRLADTVRRCAPSLRDVTGDVSGDGAGEGTGTSERPSDELAAAQAVAAAVRTQPRADLAARVTEALGGVGHAGAPAALRDAARRGDATGTVLTYLVGRAALHAPGTPPVGVPGERCGVDAPVLVREALADAAEVAAVRGWPVLALACRAEHALACARTSRLGEARRRARAVLTEAAALGPAAAPAVVAAHLAEGLVALWTDDVATARRALAAVLRDGTARPELVARAAAVLVHVGVAEGDAAGVASALATLDAAPPAARGPAGVSRPFLAAGVRLASGATGDALALVGRTDPAFTSVAGACRRSEMLLRAGERRAAWSVLPDDARQGSWHVADLVAVHVARALLHDDPRNAHAALERALAASAAEGVVRPLRDRAADLRRLLLAHLGRGSAHEDLVTRLLTADGPGGVSREPGHRLTERERHVLACLPSHMTVGEIGAALFVSPNTVKTHVRSVYRKLGVTSRRDAVRTAVERGLL